MCSLGHGLHTFTAVPSPCQRLHIAVAVAQTQPSAVRFEPGSCYTAVTRPMRPAVFSTNVKLFYLLFLSRFNVLKLFFYFLNVFVIKIVSTNVTQNTILMMFHIICYDI